MNTYLVIAGFLFAYAIAGAYAMRKPNARAGKLLYAIFAIGLAILLTHSFMYRDAWLKPMFATQHSFEIDCKSQLCPISYRNPTPIASRDTKPR